jgi:predicted ArsR family transcriptional regulator
MFLLPRVLHVSMGVPWKILGGMEGSILELLGQHGSLAADQVAAHLGKQLDAVNERLRDMRDRGLVDVLAVGELEGNLTTAASYWRLTDKGRNELARRRSK